MDRAVPTSEPRQKTNIESSSSQNSLSFKLNAEIRFTTEPGAFNYSRLRLIFQMQEVISNSYEC